MKTAQHKPTKKELEQRKQTFVTRSKSAIFIGIFALVYAMLLFFSNERWFSPIAPHPQISFVLNFLNLMMVVVLIYFVSKEITNLCFPGRKKVFVYTAIALFVQTVGCSMFLLLTRYELVNTDWQTISINPWDLFLIIALCSVVFFTILSTIVWRILGRKMVYVQKKVKFWYPFLMFALTTFFIGFFYVTVIHTWTTLMFLIVLSIGCDLFAYVGGTIFGKHKMAPMISPKKSWEGLFFGIGVTLALYLAIIGIFFIPGVETYNDTHSLYCFLGVQTCPTTNINPINLQPYYWAIYILVGIVIMIVSTCGDLFFSFIKRRFDIKDFSNLIPGHGGILDRLDALIFVFAFYFFITTVLQLAMLCAGHTNGLQFLWGKPVNF